MVSSRFCGSFSSIIVQAVCFETRRRWHTSLIVRSFSMRSDIQFLLAYETRARPHKSGCVNGANPALKRPDRLQIPNLSFSDIPKGQPRKNLNYSHSMG